VFSFCDENYQALVATCNVEEQACTYFDMVLCIFLLHHAAEALQFNQYVEFLIETQNLKNQASFKSILFSRLHIYD